jgi:uncharacterized protein YlxW (UPF0749 family)
MRLLREVMDHPLDPAYQDAARRRAAGVRPRRSGLVVTLVVAVLCGWALTRGATELRRPVPGAASGQAGLEQEINRRTALADAKQKQIQRLAAEIAAAQQAQLDAAGDATLAAQAQQLGQDTGVVPVTGPGLEIILRDARTADSQVGVDPRATTGPEDGRVLDRDLQIVVNGLWVAGAEAVAINDHRLTALSAIRSAGAAILVDFRPIVPPYVVHAIGDPIAMQSGFAADLAGRYVQSLRDNYGVQVAINSATSLTLPAAGTFDLHQARAPSQPAPSGTSPSGTSSATSTPPSTSTEVSP